MVPGRWFMMLVITPCCLLLFGGGGAWVIAGDFGFGDRSVQVGIAAGLVVIVLLAVVGLLRRPLSDEELRQSRAAYSRVTGGGAILAYAGIGTVLAVLLIGSALAPFLISFCFALMTGASVLAGVLALTRRGLHQSEAAGGYDGVWTHTQAGRVPASRLPPDLYAERRLDAERRETGTDL